MYKIVKQAVRVRISKLKMEPIQRQLRLLVTRKETVVQKGEKGKVGGLVRPLCSIRVVAIAFLDSQLIQSFWSVFFLSQSKFMFSSHCSV